MGRGRPSAAPQVGLRVVCSPQQVERLADVVAAGRRRSHPLGRLPKHGLHDVPRQGPGYLFDGVSPHEEEIMPCDNPGMRPQRRRAAWKSKPLGVVMAEASKVSAKEAEAAASAVKVKKYVARLAASVTGTGALKQHGQEGYLSPNSARRARKLCNRHKKVIVKFETETPAREAQEPAEATPAACSAIAQHVAPQPQEPQPLQPFLRTLRNFFFLGEVEVAAVLACQLLF